LSGWSVCFFCRSSTLLSFSLSLHDALPIYIGRRFSRAYATGWALSLGGRVRAFPLSSHADFDQLISFVKACDPDKVYIFTGFAEDRKSTRLNSSHQIISYAVFCLKKKKKTQ